MLTHLDGFRAKLSKTLKASDTVLPLCTQHGELLNALPIGAEVYLTIEDCRKYELVKYTHSAPVQMMGNYVELVVERRVVSMGMYNFAPVTPVFYQISGYILDKALEG